MTSTPPTTPSINPWLKIVLELGPLLLFFAANSRFGIFVGTATFMVAVVLALGASYMLTRHVPLMTLVSAVVVMVFGGLTLVLQDELFIKLKPTIIYSLFGAVLLGGLMTGKPFLALLFDSVFHLTEEGWRRLTQRWILFFFVLAVANELVWRTQSTDVWLSFKVFGVMPLTFLFGALQYPLVTKYHVEPNQAPAAERQ